MAKLEEEIRQLHAERGVTPHQIIENMLDTNTRTHNTHHTHHNIMHTSTSHASSLSSPVRTDTIHVTKTRYNKFYQHYPGSVAGLGVPKSAVAVTRDESEYTDKTDNNCDNSRGHHLNTHDLQSFRDQYNIQQNKNKRDDSNSNQSMSACSDIEDQVSGDERPPAQVVVRESEYSKYRAGTMSSSNCSGNAPHSSDAYTSGSNSGGSNESDNQPNSGDEKVLLSSSSSSDCSSSASRHRSSSTTDNTPDEDTVPHKAAYPGGYPAHYYPRDHDHTVGNAYGNEVIPGSHIQMPTTNNNKGAHPYNSGVTYTTMPGGMRRVASNPQF